jgi:hypothetical protein
MMSDSQHSNVNIALTSYYRRGSYWIATNNDTSSSARPGAANHQRTPEECQKENEVQSGRFPVIIDFFSLEDHNNIVQTVQALATAPEGVSSPVRLSRDSAADLNPVAVHNPLGAVPDRGK